MEQGHRADGGPSGLPGTPVPALQTMSLDRIRAIACDAGAAIMEVYSGDFSVRAKHDASPLTEADLAAHAIIEARLREEFPQIPLLSEEGSEQVPYATRKHWRRYWLVDPLDGTKEFVKRNGQFTVNIALIDGNRPVAGVVHLPATGTTYWGAESAGSFKSTEAGDAVPIRCSAIPASGRLRVVGSSSHRSAETDRYLQALRRRYSDMSFLAVGSSIKICMVAEGAADIYPRFGPTMEWDTAAAHAILNTAGGRLIRHDTGEDLSYNKPDLLNQWFVAEAPRSGDGGK